MHRPVILKIDGESDTIKSPGLEGLAGALSGAATETKNQVETNRWRAPGQGDALPRQQI
jgi:hypothetical protein